MKTDLEYKLLLKEIQARHRLEILEFNKDVAYENNPIQIGDVIEDHIGKLVVEKIGVYLGYTGDLPCSTYYGTALKKDGTPTKRLEKRTAYQSNLINK